MTRSLGWGTPPPHQLVPRNTAGQARRLGPGYAICPFTWYARAQMSPAEAICSQGIKAHGLRTGVGRGGGRRDKVIKG